MAKNLKTFIFILISTYIVGMILFYYSLGIDAIFYTINKNAGLLDNIKDVSFIDRNSDVEFKNGYIGSKGEFEMPGISYEEYEEFSYDFVDGIVEEYSGMGMDDIENFLENIPLG